MSTSSAEFPQPEQTADQGRSERVTAFPTVPTHVKSAAEREGDARFHIARRLVLAYVLLLTLTFVLPIALLWVPRVSTSIFSLTDARDLMLAMSGTLSGLVGILGFVMGYYFKAFDKPPEGKVSTKRSTKKK
jgi:hypothetical protein